MLPYVISAQPSNRLRVHKGRTFWVCHDQLVGLSAIGGSQGQEYKDIKIWMRITSDSWWTFLLTTVFWDLISDLSGPC